MAKETSLTENQFPDGRRFALRSYDDGEIRLDADGGPYAIVHAQLHGTHLNVRLKSKEKD